MKKLIALILIISTFLLCACGEDAESTEYGFIVNETNIEYVDCTPMGLYPVAAGEEFVTVKEGETETVYYEVEFEEPENFLCYEDSGNYFLVRAKTLEEPTAATFNPVAAFIYGSTNTVYIDTLYADEEYRGEESEASGEEDYGETELCQAISNALATGEHVETGVTLETISDQFYIRLLSPDYPGLYYLVSFYGYNGRYYLRDGASDKTVFCPRDVIVRMVGE